MAGVERYWMRFFAALGITTGVVTKNIWRSEDRRYESCGAILAGASRLEAWPAA
jgi:hypothetical protein